MPFCSVSPGQARGHLRRPGADIATQGPVPILSRSHSPLGHKVLGS